MGFGGGNTGSLPDHDHDPAVSNDGGTLNANATSFNLSSGSLLYSDGSNVQELGIGSSNDELRVSAGSIPEWYTPSAAASTWTELCDVSVTNSSLSSGTITAMSQLDVWIKAANTSAQNTAITFNATNSSYNNNQWIDSTLSTAAGTSEIPIYGSNTTDESFIHMSIFNPSSGVIGYTWSGTNFGTGSGSTPISLAGNGYSYGSQVTRIDRTLYGGGSQNVTGRMVIFGAN